jgi:cytochrome c oxidase subunit 1
VVGGPYEYGVPGAVHGIFAPAPVPATVGGAPGGAGGILHAPTE